MSRTANPDSPAKKKLLDAAERLILERGFAATTVDDICCAAGLTKGSFFHYFDNKDDLCKAVLAHTMEKRRRLMKDAPFTKLADPLDRVLGRLDFLAEMSRVMFQDPDVRAGCLIGNLTQELAHTRPDIRSQCADCLQEVAQDLEGDLAEAKAKHAPRARIDPHSLAEHFVAVMEGSFVLAKAQQGPKAIESNLLHLKKYFRGLFDG